jgi:FlaA1/EpsC-like NDP-sugar epimerase
MATEIPLPAPEQIGFRTPSVQHQPWNILRSAVGTMLPALLDLCCIAVAAIGGILLYQLYRPLEARDAWLLLAELGMKYGPAFVILAQAHHLYTQRATLLQVADTARILRVSAYCLTLLSVGNYFTKAETPRLLVTYFWAFATVMLVVQRYSTSRMIRAYLRYQSRNPPALFLSAAFPRPWSGPRRVRRRERIRTSPCHLQP